MPVRSAFPGPRDARRHARPKSGPAPDDRGRSTPRPRTPEGGRVANVRAEPAPGEAAAAAPEPAALELFRVASRDRLIPRQRAEAAEAPRFSYEVILAVAIVVACMCGALAVGAAFTLPV